MACYKILISFLTWNTVSKHTERRPCSNWPRQNNNSTSFPCRYSQKAGFVCPWETATRTYKLTRTAYTPADETADGTTWQCPYGAWAPEVDIIRNGIHFHNPVAWSPNCMRLGDDYIKEQKISVILYINNSLLGDSSQGLEAWGASLPLTHIGHARHCLKFEDRNKAVISVTNSSIIQQLCWLPVVLK